MSPGSSYISDEFMREMLAKTKSYTVVLLRATRTTADPDARVTTWEHGRRNFALRAQGLLPIVCPIAGSDSLNSLSGLCLFNADLEETQRLMDEDPAVRAGILTYEVYTARSFPGDALPS